MIIEAGWFELPYSGLIGLISTQFHQTSKAEDHRKWIAPNIPVEVLSTDYFFGKDEAMDGVMKVIIEEFESEEEKIILIVA